MDYDPISVALKFGFLAVLYLFLLWIARSALKDLRGTVAPAPDATGFHPVPAFERAAGGGDAWLVAERGGGLERGRALRPDRRPLDRPLAGGRRADRGPLRLRPAREDLLPRGRTYVEDMNSTNGTLLNDADPARARRS